MVDCCIVHFVYLIVIEPVNRSFNQLGIGRDVNYCHVFTAWFDAPLKVWFQPAFIEHISGLKGKACVRPVSE